MTERRKDNFKSTGSIESRVDRSIRNRTVQNKFKRDETIAAKRLRVDGDTINPEFQCNLRDVLEKVKSSDLTQLSAGLQMLRNVLSKPFPGVDLVPFGLIDILIQLLLSIELSISIDSAWCLANLTAGSHETTLQVIPATPTIVHLLQNPSISTILKEQLCWILGNIAGDSDECRHSLLNNNCHIILLSFLLDSCNFHFNEGIRTSVWALSNLIRGDTTIECFALVPGSFELLVSLLNHTDSSVRTDVCWFFAFLTAKQNEDHRLTSLLLHTPVQLVSALLQVGSGLAALTPLAIIPLLRCFFNLLSGPVEWLTANPLAVESVRIILVQCIAGSFSGTGGHSSSESRAVTKEALAVTELLVSKRPQSMQWSDLLTCTVDAACCDVFDVQTQALAVLACGVYSDSTAAVSVLMSLPAEKLRGLLLSLVELLRSPAAESEAVSDCIVVLRAVAVYLMASNDPLLLLDYVLSLEVTDALDNLRYNQGGNSREAGDLVELLYQHMEEQEARDAIEEDTSVDTEVQQQPYQSGMSQTLFDFSSLSGSTAATSEPTQGGGRGRGSHLNQPAWMTNTKII